MVGVALRLSKSTPRSSANEKRIDSFVAWLIQTLGHPDQLTYLVIWESEWSKLQDPIISIFGTRFLKIYFLDMLFNRAHLLRTLVTFWQGSACLDGEHSGGITSTHNKQGCAILTKKVAPKNPEVT